MTSTTNIAVTSRRPSIVTPGLALFSMFFGAGNVIFPLLLGDFAGGRLIWAILGFLLTGVLIPLMGLMAMILYDCERAPFFNRLGRIPGYFLCGTLALLLGPLGCTPRLITISYATIAPYLGNLSLLWFSLIACVVIGFLAYRASRYVKILGLILTPLLLCGLAYLISNGLINNAGEISFGHSVRESFAEGLTQGYNLLDMVAALLYASLVLFYFKDEGDNDPKDVVRRTFGASLIASSLLTIAYTGMIVVGAYHVGYLRDGCPPEATLNALSIHLLGKLGGPVGCLVVSLACITTACSQIIVCTRWLEESLVKFQVRVKDHRIDTLCEGNRGHILALITTLILAFGMSNLGFSGVGQWLAPILTLVHPALIVLCLCNIFHKLYGLRPVKGPVIAAFLVTLFGFIF